MVADMPNDTTGEHLLARRYRLVNHVGRGGMGAVWKAHDEVLGRDVAVKEVILPHGLTDEERAVQYKRTFREARAAARLGHPGVVTVYDVVEEDGRPWIVMELIHARSLDQVIKQDGPLDVRRAADIGRQMLAALHAAHDAGVLHRDVKPSNVLVTGSTGRGERAVLTDFGIATAAGDATLTQTGLVMGSPAYIAPERARGRTAGPASDLWSLGVTLYAMLHGRSPFERNEPMAALVAVITEEPEPPSRAGRLTPVIEGLLRKNPDQRMDAIEAGALLDEIVRQETVDDQRTLAVEVPAERRPEPPADRTRVGVPVPDPGPAGTSPAGRPGLPAPGRNALLIGVIALVVLIAVASIVYASTRHDGKPSGKPSGTPTRHKAAPPSSPLTTRPVSTGTPGIPAGFHRYSDRTGYTVAIPDGWTGPKHRQYGDYFYGPDGHSYIQIAQTSSPGASALDDWRRQENGGRGFRGYERVRIEPTGDHPPVPDTGDGAKSADWEFTHTLGWGRAHVLNRGFVANGHGYAILVTLPDSGWSGRIAALEPVFAFFTPAR
jgi:serine/threonine protein kinase